MDAWLGYAALLALVLALGLWCRARVEREYDRGGLLSVGTGWLVWILYVLQAALVAVPAGGAWRALPGRPLLWRAVGSLLIGPGLVLLAWGIASFHSFRRMNGRDTSELIVSGAYRYSRNPQNVGIGLVLAGAALLGRSSIALAAAVVFWVMFRAYLPMEERFLEATHGDRYRAYRSSTPRCFGFPGTGGDGAPV